MKRKQTTALILAALITASMAGCQAGSAQTAPQQEVTAEAAELTALAETTVEPTEGTASKNGWDYSEFKELPEGWTMEKLFNMISIDGYQLSFPCTVDDILSLSDDFSVKESPYNYDPNEIGAVLYYKNICIGSLGYDSDRNVDLIGISVYPEDSIVTICGVELTNREAMADLLSTLGDDVSSGDGLHIDEHFVDEQNAVVFKYSGNTDSLSIVWEEII